GGAPAHGGLAAARRRGDRARGRTFIDADPPDQHTALIVAPSSPSRVPPRADASGARRAGITRKIITRVALLGIAGVSLYLLAPSLLAVFSSWPKLRNLDPLWLVLAVLFECMSYVALWSLQRIALRTRSWFAVGTSQLASSAAGSIVPGGAAT